jgi:hypothetical protein
MSAQPGASGGARASDRSEEGGIYAGPSQQDALPALLCGACFSTVLGFSGQTETGRSAPLRHGGNVFCVPNTRTRTYYFFYTRAYQMQCYAPLGLQF